MNNNGFSLIELERAKMVLGIIELQGFFESDLPTMVMLGGQPAAGKTGLIRKLVQENSFLVINGDSYRSYHPRYEEILHIYRQQAPDYTQSFSNALVEYMKDKCLTEKIDFLIEGTMRRYEVIENTAVLARQKGFRVEFHILAVAKEDSYLGVFQRYEGDMKETGMGRFSSLETHDEAYNQIPINLNKAHLNKLFDALYIYKRNREGEVELAYYSANTMNTPEQNINFQTLFKQLRTPYMPSTFYFEQWSTIENQALQRGETDTNYLNSIAEFKRHFMD